MAETPQTLAEAVPQIVPQTVPKISVVVPCYNSGWSVGDTLLSIRAQSFTDLEILLIDDGSTEDLTAALAPHRDDPRLRVVRQENRGLAGARNRGLAEARAPYVAFIDADDLWHPDFLARTHAALEAQPGASYAFALCFHFDQQNRYLIPSTWTGLNPRHDVVGLASTNVVGNGSAALFRTAVIRDVGGFDETMRARGATGAEDWKLCILMAARGTPVMLTDQLVAYRLVQSSMSQGDPARQMRAGEMVISDLAPLLPQVPRHAWANARIMTAGWLVPAYRRAGRHREAVMLMLRAYLGSPLFLLSANLRKAHRMKIEYILRRQFNRWPAECGQPLASLRFGDGSMPFAFLSRSTIGATAPEPALTGGPQP